MFGFGKKADGNTIRAAIKKFGTAVRGDDGSEGTVLCVGSDTARKKFGKPDAIEKKMAKVGIQVAVKDIKDKESGKKLTCVICETKKL